MSISTVILCTCTILTFSLADLRFNSRRLARIKAEARKKREERERVERLRVMEADRRHKSLQEQFKDWHVGRLFDAKVELALVSVPSHASCV